MHDEDFERNRANLTNGEAVIATQERSIAGLEATLGPAARTPRATLPAQPCADAIRVLQQRGELERDERVLGQWLGWDPGCVVGVLSGTIRELHVDQIAQVCEALHCSPYSVWGPTLGRDILDVYGPEQWPAYIEPLLEEPAAVSEFVRRRVDQLAGEVVTPRVSASGPLSPAQDADAELTAVPAVSRRGREAQTMTERRSASSPHDSASVGVRLVDEWTAVEASPGRTPTFSPVGGPGDALRG